jgi:hypothetical protein
VEPHCGPSRKATHALKRLFSKDDLKPRLRSGKKLRLFPITRLYMMLCRFETWDLATSCEPRCSASIRQRIRQVDTPVSGMTRFENPTVRIREEIAYRNHLNLVYTISHEWRTSREAVKGPPLHHSTRDQRPAAERGRRFHLTHHPMITTATCLFPSLLQAKFPREL